jgi:NAD(P)H-hydrate epimerase
LIVDIRPLSRDEVRGIDARAAGELGLPTLVLMENAGRGAAAWLRDHGGIEPGPGGPGEPGVLIVCGRGNNGGDGGVVARHLDAWGYAVRVVWLARADELAGDAAVQAGILGKAGIKQSFMNIVHQVDQAAFEAMVEEAAWVVDGIFGTGLTRPVEGAYLAAIEAINRSGRPVLALDLPSGLDADSGRPLGAAVRARATATFVAPKLGFAAPGAREYTGEVVVVDIGVPRCILEPYRGP